MIKNLNEQPIGYYAQYEISDWYFWHPKIGYCKIDYLNEERLTYSPNGAKVEIFCDIQNDGVMDFLKTIKDRTFTIVRCRVVKNDNGEEYVLRETFGDSTFVNYTEALKNVEDHSVMGIVISTKSEVSKDFIEFDKYSSDNIVELFKEQNFANDKARELYDKIWEAKTK